MSRRLSFCTAAAVALSAGMSAPAHAASTTTPVWTAIYGVTSIGLTPWTSAPIRIPTPIFRVAYDIRCYALEGANVTLTWDNKVVFTTPTLTYDAESETFKAAGSVATKGGAKRSTFAMKNPDGSQCFTDFKVLYPKS